MDKEIVKELIQNKLSTTNLVNELTKIISIEPRKKMLKDYETLNQKLGGIGASKRAATLIFGYLKP